MAGGAGAERGALGRWRAEPALPFGGQHRTIDFTLSNCVNSGVRQIALLTQQRSQSLAQHLQRGWSFLRADAGEFIDSWPSGRGTARRPYVGTADAVLQNLDLIEQLAPERVLLLAGEHVYRMDYRALLEAHVEKGRGATVACVEMPISSAPAHDVLRTRESGRVMGFAQRPSRPWSVDGDAGTALVSMGVFVFDRELLVDCLQVDASDPSSTHDFSSDIVPLLVRANTLAAHTFRDAETGARGYWRDVGTLDAYWQANLELADDPPALDLHDRNWPIGTGAVHRPPASFVGSGAAQHAVVSPGCQIGGRVERSVLSPDCRVAEGAVVARSVLWPGAAIGANAVVRGAIVEAGCAVPDGFVVGENAIADRARFDVSPRGVVLVTAAALARLSDDPKAARRSDCAG
jgi:glucose-1-phosphate adenylyltransferase